MNDHLIQLWLDGESTDRPSDADLAEYQRLYKALAEEPEEQLADGFSARVVQRISEIESESKVDQIVNILGLLAAAVGFVVLLAFSAKYVALDLSSMTTILNSITLPTGLLSQTWLYTGLVCGLIAWLDKYVLARHQG
jgi:hypothetical protein